MLGCIEKHGEVKGNAGLKVSGRVANDDEAEGSQMEWKWKAYH
jgi:hypothetical protein